VRVVSGDQPRYLSRSSVPPYVNHPARGMRGEPEAVDHDTQEWLTLQAHMRERERRRRAWEPIRSDLLTAANLLVAQQITRSSNARVLERFVARLDRNLR